MMSVYKIHKFNFNSYAI